MKTQKTVIRFFLVVIFTSTIISCAKEGDKKANCRIISITEEGTGGGSTTYNFAYNNDGKMATLNTSGNFVSNKVFTYIANTIIIHATYDGGTFGSIDSITVDNKGRPLNIRKYYDQDRRSWSNKSFEYSGDDLLRLQQTNETSVTPETFVAISVDGNMVSLQSPSDTFALEYYRDKAIQPGDYLEFISLYFNGINIYPHKNLVKAFGVVGAIITNCSYEMNDDGLISKVIVTGGTGVYTLTYQYQCD